jgi:hypothetical protein
MSGGKAGYFSRYIPDENTHQHWHAVDIGQKLCDFVPRLWRVLCAQEMLPTPGWWIQQKCWSRLRGPSISADEGWFHPAGSVKTRDASAHYHVLSVVRLPGPKKPFGWFDWP